MTIAGYKYGEVLASPVSVPELELLKKKRSSGQKKTTGICGWQGKCYRTN